MAMLQPCQGLEANRSPQAPRRTSAGPAQVPQEVQSQIQCQEMVLSELVSQVQQMYQPQTSEDLPFPTTLFPELNPQP